MYLVILEESLIQCLFQVLLPYLEITSLVKRVLSDVV